MEKLKKIINDKPSLKLLSKAKLIQKIRDEYDNIPVSVIKEYYDSREVNQVFKPPTSKLKNKLVITGPTDSFQIDIIMLPDYKIYNKNIDKVLLIINVISRKIWAYPLNSGKMEDVLEAYEEFIKDVNADVSSVTGDNFFNNESFQVFNDELGISVYTDIAKDDHITNQGNKLGIIDRSVRTLKGLINKYMIENENLKWTEYLDEIVDAYNDSPHRGLKNLTPNEVYDDEMYGEKLHEAQSKYNKNTFDDIRYDIGDKVRYMLGKKTFEKEKQKFSSEICEIVDQEGYRYQLKDEKGKIMERLYRPNELQKVDNVKERSKGKELVDSAKKRHVKTRAIQKDTGKTYDEVQDDINKVSSAKTKSLYNNKGERIPRMLRSGKRV